jgi:hypothetical protein
MAVVKGSVLGDRRAYRGSFSLVNGVNGEGKQPRRSSDVY